MSLSKNYDFANKVLHLTAIPLACLCVAPVCVRTLTGRRRQTLHSGSYLPSYRSTSLRGGTWECRPGAVAMALNGTWWQLLAVQQFCESWILLSCLMEMDRMGGRSSITPPIPQRWKLLPRAMLLSLITLIFTNLTVPPSAWTFPKGE